MTILTRIPTEFVGPNVAGLPRITTAYGMTPHRRWVPASLPAQGEKITSWVDILTSEPMTNTTTASDVPVVGVEGGVKHAVFDGVSNRLSRGGMLPEMLRTIIVVARPNTGDIYTGSGVGPIMNASAVQILQGTAQDTASITGTTTTLPAPRNKWHVYALSLPAEGEGAFVVDGNATSFAPSSRNLNQINLARSSSNYRQLRVVEALTSDKVYSAAALMQIAANIRAAYPALAW